MRTVVPKRRVHTTFPGWKVFSGGLGRPVQSGTQADLSFGPVSGHVDRGRSVSDDMLARSALEQRQIESAIRALASEFILVQDAEKKRVAAELHDGINQDIAVIAIDLGILAQNLHSSPDSVKEEILRIQDRVFALSNEVRSLSHGLHPSIVEHLGLSGALRVYCRDFERREGISVEFIARNVASRYKATIELAMYRICQEALRNAKQHSQTSRIRVTLQNKRGGVLLTIADSGRGFDLSTRAASHGLGLSSMRERARLLDGYLSIRSQLNVGTEVEAFIPVNKEVRL